MPSAALRGYPNGLVCGGVGCSRSALCARMCSAIVATHVARWQVALYNSEIAHCRALVGQIVLLFEVVYIRAVRADVVGNCRDVCHPVAGCRDNCLNQTFLRCRLRFVLLWD